MLRESDRYDDCGLDHGPSVCVWCGCHTDGEPVCGPTCETAFRGSLTDEAADMRAAWGGPTDVPDGGDGEYPW